MKPRRWKEVCDRLPPLSRAERAALKESIDREGVRYPVLILPDGRTIDGHHRWELSGGKAKVEVLNIPEDRAFALALALNICRRQMSGEQIADIQERLRKDKELRKQAALEMRRQGKSQPEVSKAIGVPQPTLSGWEAEEKGSNIESDIASIPDLRIAVPKTAHKAIAERAAKGEKPAQIAADYKVTPKRIKQIVSKVEAKAGRRERNGELTGTTVSLETLISQKRTFATIYADPPWRYGNQGTRASTDNHYPTMTVDEIAALPVQQLVGDDAHLHLWTTNAFLFDARKVLEAWGFEYKSCFVWVKPQMGIGNYWRVSHEFLLLGVRGDCPFLDRSQMSWLKLDRTRHSAKPLELRKIIERVSPGPRLELFGRDVADGWVVWGNQIAKGMFDGDVKEFTA